MTNQIAVRPDVRDASKRRRQRLRDVPIERHHRSEVLTLPAPPPAERSRPADLLVRILRSFTTRTDAD
jgi:hypothetical protein